MTTYGNSAPGPTIFQILIFGIFNRTDSKIRFQRALNHLRVTKKTEDMPNLRILWKLSILLYTFL